MTDARQEVTAAAEVVGAVEVGEVGFVDGERRGEVDERGTAQEEGVEGRLTEAQAVEVEKEEFVAGFAREMDSRNLVCSCRHIVSVQHLLSRLVWTSDETRPPLLDSACDWPRCPVWNAPAVTPASVRVEPTSPQYRARPPQERQLGRTN